jgi:hypothetical protein
MDIKLPLQAPAYDELMWPTLKALKAMGGSASNEELLAKVIELEGIPELDFGPFRQGSMRPG